MARVRAGRDGDAGQLVRRRCQRPVAWAH
jgi:hypothetical protein